MVSQIGGGGLKGLYGTAIKKALFFPASLGIKLIPPISANIETYTATLFYPSISLSILIFRKDFCAKYRVHLDLMRCMTGTIIAIDTLGTSIAWI